MFSSITMASSTTKPTAMVKAIKDRLSRLKLSTNIIATVPSSASGTVTPGMIVAQTVRKNRKITSTTSTMVIISVISTSLTEALMVVVRLATVSTLMEGGTEANACGSSASTWSTASMTFAPGCLNISSTIPC